MIIGDPVVMVGPSTVKGKIGIVHHVEERSFCRVFLDVNLGTEGGGIIRVREVDVELLDLTPELPMRRPEGGFISSPLSDAGRRYRERMGR
jgi:hypothetical protein